MCLLYTISYVYMGVLMYIHMFVYTHIVDVVLKIFK